MQKALFLYNPAAGRGRIARNVGGIVDIFSENGWELTPEKIDFGRNPFDAHPDIRMVGCCNFLFVMEYFSPAG